LRHRESARTHAHAVRVCVVSGSMWYCLPHTIVRNRDRCEKLDRKTLLVCRGVPAYEHEEGREGGERARFVPRGPSGPLSMPRCMSPCEIKTRCFIRCVLARVRACVRACGRVCVCACVRVCVQVATAPRTCRSCNRRCSTMPCANTSKKK
jgi:hypothetical protein